MLDMGNENFEGELNTKKYISLTKVSKATAVSAKIGLNRTTMQELDRTQKRSLTGQ